MEPSPLPPAPRTLVHERGIPAFGRYCGEIEQLSWQRLAGAPLARLWSRLQRQRWQQILISHPELFITIGLIDTPLGGAAQAFVYQRQQQRPLAQLNLSALSGSEGAERPFGDATFRDGGHTLALRRTDTRLELTVNSPQLMLAVHLALPEAERTLAAVVPAERLAHSTHKCPSVVLGGLIEVNGLRTELTASPAQLDSSDGLLGRQASWRRLAAHGHGLGFNLADGFMDDAENALWIDEQLFRLGALQLEHHPDGPWQLSSDDGLLDLQFHPEGSYHAELDPLFGKREHQLCLGHFSGTLTHPQTGEVYPVNALPGLAEAHHRPW